jgi:hypothetical protein
VTNPAIDPFREAVVTSLRCFIGPEGDVTELSEAHAHRLDLHQPVLRLSEMQAIKDMRAGGWRTKVRPRGVLTWCGSGAVDVISPPLLPPLQSCCAGRTIALLPCMSLLFVCLLTSMS